MTGEPTFHILHQYSDWRTPLAAGWRRDIALGGTLCLVADTDGPLALHSPDGSLGRLTLPKGVALDARGRLYVVGGGGRLYRTVNDCMNPDAPLTVVELSTLGGSVPGDRHFGPDAALALVDDRLYVADTETGRVMLFALPNLALLDVWQFGVPVDVYAHEGSGYILAGSRVYRHDSVALQFLFDDPSRPWQRILVDRQGRIILYDPTQAGKRLAVFIHRLDRQFHPYELDGTYDDANDVRSRFATLPVIQHQIPGAEPTLVFPGGTLTRDGVVVTPDPLEPPRAAHRLYVRSGVYIVALDSGQPDCAWDRIELEMESLPPGTRVTCATHPAEVTEGLSIDAALNSQVQAYWDPAFTLVAPLQPQPDGQRHPEPGLVNSRGARGLALRIELHGDGYNTPQIRAVRVHFPRQSYLNYLPAVFSSDGESRRFLERVLAIFQIAWGDLEERIRTISRYYDPATVPGGEAMEFLASWLDLLLPTGWTPAQKRRLLCILPQILEQRGRIDGLRTLLRAYLASMAGLDVAQLGAYPVITEGFFERQHAVLEGGLGLPMWGAAYRRRLQLDVYAVEGEVELVSHGDPQRDLFDHYAHFFRVFVPAAFVRSEHDEQLLRHVLDTEKPAHTHYELHLVPARFRVGQQALLGIDTIVGALPAQTVLGESELGYDTVLGSQRRGKSG